MTARELDGDLVVLLVGSDARLPYEGARADVIIVAHASPEPTEPVTLVSIPRDVTLDIPCVGRRRVNAALNGCPDREVSGLELLALTVEDFAGLTVDHVAAVGFDGFEAVVDELGGYRVCTDHPVRDIDAHLRLAPGCQTLDGEIALSWVRSRSPEVMIDGTWHRVPSSDLDRTDTQRDLLTDLAERARRRRDAAGIGRLIEAVAQTVTIDDDWSIRSMIGSALELRDRPIVGGRIDTRPYTDEWGRAVLEARESYGEARSRLLEAARERSSG